MEVAECHKAFYGFHGYMDIRLLGKVVLWLNGNMAALHKVVQCTSKRVYFVCFVNSFLYLRIYLSQYIRRCLHHNTEAPSEFLLKVCSGSLKTAMDWSICFFFLPLGTIFALTPRYLSTQVLKCLSLNANVLYVKKNCHRKYPRPLINQ